VKTCAATHRRSATWGCVLGCAVILVAPALARGGNLLHGQLEVSAQGLCIKGIVFRKTIPSSDLQVSFARIVDFDRVQGLRPWFKLYGIGLPSFRSGWYLLNDREKALLLVTGSRYAVYVPTTRGYALLLSLDRPEEFLAALQGQALNGQVFTVLPRKGER
jgi:hypothetical protein